MYEERRGLREGGRERGFKGKKFEKHKHYQSTHLTIRYKSRFIFLMYGMRCFREGEGKLSKNEEYKKNI